MISSIVSRHRDLLDGSSAPSPPRNVQCSNPADSSLPTWTRRRSSSSPWPCPLVLPPSSSCCLSATLLVLSFVFISSHSEGPRLFHKSQSQFTMCPLNLLSSHSLLLLLCRGWIFFFSEHHQSVTESIEVTLQSLWRNQEFRPDPKVCLHTASFFPSYCRRLSHLHSPHIHSTVYACSFSF